MFLVLFFLLSLGQIGRISLYNQQINFYVYEILAACWFTWLLIKYKLQPILTTFTRFKFIYFWLLFLMFSYLLNIAGYSLFQNIVALLYLLRLTFYFIFFIYLIYEFKQKQNYQNKLDKGILLFILLTIFFSLGQYFLYPDLRNLFYLGWDPHLYRAFGLFLDTSTFAALIGTSILYLLIDFRNIYLGRNFKIVILVLLSILALLTYARGFYIAILVTVAYFLFKQKLFRWMIVLMLIFIIGLYLLPKKFGEGVNLQRTFSINSRAVNYKEGLKIWETSPLIGIGYNRLSYAKEKFRQNQNNSFGDHSLASLNSSFLIILSTAGAVGLGLFILLLFKLTQLGPLAKYLTVFLSLYSLSDNILLQSFVLMFFLLLLLKVSRT